MTYPSPPFLLQRTKNVEGTLRRRSLFPEKEETFWRVKRPTAQQNEVTSPPISSKQQDLQASGLLSSQVLSTEEVLAEIQEATNLYLSCPDPTEAAARRQRVQQGDTQELLAKTASGIIAAAAGSALTIPPVTEKTTQTDQTQENIMQELENVTAQYLSCADPIENVARRQRVLQGDP